MEHSALSVALLRQRLVSLLQAMPAAQAGDEVSVHQARVASRRLRGALPVLGARADEAALDRAKSRVRRITRALGPVRELDVTLLLLAELEGKEKRRRAMLDEITPSRLEKLRRRLVEVAAPQQHRQTSRSTLAEAAEQTTQRAKNLRAAIDRAGGIYLADRLHRVRIEAKKLRYALEIQRELARSRSTVGLNRLKHQQDLLGRIHDLEVLIEHTREVQASLPATNRRAMAELNRLIRAVEAETREGHAEYMRGRSGLIQLCDDLSHAGVP